MLNVNRIGGVENTYKNRNNVSFGSKFVPNDALQDAFHIAQVSLECGRWGAHSAAKAMRFTKILAHLVNDGKDDLVKVTRSATGSTLQINGKRVNFHRERPASSVFVDGERVINNIVDYFSVQNKVVDCEVTSPEEFKIIKPSILNLKSDLRADILKKSPDILNNIEKNIQDVNSVLQEHFSGVLKNLKGKIFG